MTATAERTISHFRLYLSAKTPADKEIKIAGNEVANDTYVIHAPEDVFKAMSQSTAKKTVDVPKTNKF